MENENEIIKKEPVTTHKPYTYAILMETSGAECESWLYFIRKEGNENALKHLQKQLSKVEWKVIDDLSTFDLELDYFVSEQTAKEMTRVDLNSCAFHRKFDGKLDFIDLQFKEKDRDISKMGKAFDSLGYGQIEDYISDEDISEDEGEDNNNSEEEKTVWESDSSADSVKHKKNSHVSDCKKSRKREKEKDKKKKRKEKERKGGK